MSKRCYTPLSYDRIDNGYITDSGDVYAFADRVVCDSISCAPARPAVEAIKVAKVSPGDVILLKISDQIDVYQCNQILEEVQKAFPCNNVLLCNSHVLEDISILRPDLDLAVDIDKMFSDIMKGNPNDFLH